MKIKSRLAPAFYCSKSGYFNSFFLQRQQEQRQQEQQQRKPHRLQEQQERRLGQERQQELQFQQPFGHMQTMPEPTKRQQA